MNPSESITLVYTAKHISTAWLPDVPVGEPNFDSDVMSAQAYGCSLMCTSKLPLILPSITVLDSLMVGCYKAKKKKYPKLIHLDDLITQSRHNCQNISELTGL